MRGVAFVLALLALSLLAGAAAEPILLVAAVAAGLPHGALDGVRGRRVFGERFGRA